MAHNRAALMSPVPERLSAPAGLRRAADELEAVRAGIENALATIDSRAAKAIMADPDRHTALQTMDALTQRIAAVERFLQNIASDLGESVTIDRLTAAAGVSMSAVAARLTGAAVEDAASGECEFF